MGSWHWNGTHYISTTLLPLPLRDSAKYVGFRIFQTGLPCSAATATLGGVVAGSWALLKKIFLIRRSACYLQPQRQNVNVLPSQTRRKGNVDSAARGPDALRAAPVIGLDLIMPP
jgi:hypothetical protein